MLFAGALALTVAIGVYFGGVKTEKAEAASLKTNIFNEELEEDNLDDNNKWITLKEGTSIDVKSIGKEKLRYTANSASGIILQQNEKITVGAIIYHNRLQRGLHIRNARYGLEQSVFGAAYFVLLLFAAERTVDRRTARHLLGIVVNTRSGLSDKHFLDVSDSYNRITFA